MHDKEPGAGEIYALFHLCLTHLTRMHIQRAFLRQCLNCPSQKIFDPRIVAGAPFSLPRPAPPSIAHPPITGKSSSATRSAWALTARGMDDCHSWSRARAGGAVEGTSRIDSFLHDLFPAMRRITLYLFQLLQNACLDAAVEKIPLSSILYPLSHLTTLSLMRLPVKIVIKLERGRSINNHKFTPSVCVSVCGETFIPSAT
jgi:hypothetical protein